MFTTCQNRHQTTYYVIALSVSIHYKSDGIEQIIHIHLSVRDNKKFKKKDSLTRIHAIHSHM